MDFRQFLEKGLINQRYGGQYGPCRLAGHFILRSPTDGRRNIAVFPIGNELPRALRGLVPAPENAAAVWRPIRRGTARRAPTVERFGLVQFRDPSRRQHGSARPKGSFRGMLVIHIDFARRLFGEVLPDLLKILELDRELLFRSAPGPRDGDRNPNQARPRHIREQRDKTWKGRSVKDKV